MNAGLATQSDFYLGRESWLVAAKELCNFIQSQRSTIEFSSNGLIFKFEEDLQYFKKLAAIINDVHAKEVDLFQKRREKITSVLALLN